MLHVAKSLDGFLVLAAEASSMNTKYLLPGLLFYCDFFFVSI